MWVLYTKIDEDSATNDLQSIVHWGLRLQSGCLATAGCSSGYMAEVWWFHQTCRLVS